MEKVFKIIFVGTFIIIFTIYFNIKVSKYRLGFLAVMYIKEEIKRVAKDKKAIILAHNYQNEDIQEIADFSGDSLELSQIAATSNAEIIVLCGVHFMAESAAILAPDKKVIIPDITAGCPMADMATPDELNKMKMKHPDAKVVTYINTSAAVKALSDICCTSSNALKIVERLDAK